MGKTSSPVFGGGTNQSDDTIAWSPETRQYGWQ